MCVKFVAILYSTCCIYRYDLYLNMHSSTCLLKNLFVNIFAAD